jgi:hypothetical protein
VRKPFFALFTRVGSHSHSIDLLRLPSSNNKAGMSLPADTASDAVLAAALQQQFNTEANAVSAFTYAPPSTTVTVYSFDME